ncbi:hypothetical protein PInf_012694 [Phytophthora infestans]|nr:hypothetical protein PInf_012694 [Phytophthora infestans]
MVAIRGKKAKATAKPKTAKAKVAASKEAGATNAMRLTPQQKLAHHREEEFLALVRFALQSNLARGVTEASGQSMNSICNALLTVLCAHGKEKTLAPTQILAKLPRTERKRVCGAIFSADEIAYSCRNCQLDTTCVMCKDCFTHSDHAGHDVYFQRTTAGSSCDCGDVHFTADPGSRAIGPGGRLEAQTNEADHKTTSSEDDLKAGVLFGIGLHNDDVHSVNEVVNHLYVELGMSKPQARSAVSQVDDLGDATVATKSLLLCPGIVGNLMRRSLNMSVSPMWWEKQMEGVPALLEWLQSVSTTSDGLSELVSEALQKQRSPALRGFLPVSGSLPKGKTIQQFVKEHNIRLHNHALDVLVALISGDKESSRGHETKKQLSSSDLILC